ncbi:glycerol 3-phosphate dehydrogenase (NAD(P)+) [Carnobacterium iners]|uniref:Glycerol-3-phosphate dehydrogenase [NAD(P)+] n=1 Tax=Carnobacterium iners TaxID=1073423 RepID=A0A1X7MPV4_9LACT|nr:NAD(P)H-dependent glycerol-3-phosphate dehydrogenase [Carnobacterium iners]SEK86604.1 glycerol 3-phosphate dehydrogenase (NAD(P)+) [Carnobacterium iners]SMH26850.1 glycerol 3-phosphate dehydrogenase (NAD(P)+) [Carnobacterium iners]
MLNKIALLGAGSWGTSLSMVLEENGHEVRLWSHSQEQVDEINQFHTNKHYLPEVVLSKNIKAFTDLTEVLDSVDAVLFVVPTKAIREVAKKVEATLKKSVIIIHASKGLEQETHKRISVVLEEEISADKRKAVVVLSGPSHAEEVAVKDLTTITAASPNLESATFVQQLFMNDYFRVYTNKDIIGVELGAALKNIIALGAGALHGLGYGDNAKAALMTRGLAEISRLGVAFGANPLTFIGLSGVGDLIVTCTSVHSRNWQAGNFLGKGMTVKETLAHMDMVAEGITTTKAVYELAKERGIEMPITAAIYDVLYNHANVKEAVDSLMKRVGKSES